MSVLEGSTTEGGAEPAHPAQLPSKTAAFPKEYWASWMLDNVRMRAQTDALFRCRASAGA